MPTPVSKPGIPEEPSADGSGMAADCHFHVFAANEGLAGARYRPAYAAPLTTWSSLAATSGIARGNEPESMYMVTSAKHFNCGCCFDYGNAERDAHDDGAGTMEGGAALSARGAARHCAASCAALRLSMPRRANNLRLFFPSPALPGSHIFRLLERRP